MSSQSFVVIKWPSHNDDKVYDVRMNTILVLGLVSVSAQKVSCTSLLIITTTTTTTTVINQLIRDFWSSLINTNYCLVH